MCKPGIADPTRIQIKSSFVCIMRRGRAFIISQEIFNSPFIALFHAGSTFEKISHAGSTIENGPSDGACRSVSFSSARTLFGRNRPIISRDKTLVRGNFQMKELQVYRVSKQVNEKCTVPNKVSSSRARLQRMLHSRRKIIYRFTTRNRTKGKHCCSLHRRGGGGGGWKAALAAAHSVAPMLLKYSATAARLYSMALFKGVFP
jgi:hypothetical protein